ncbi:rod shape-determining protein MreB [Thalassotalea psychrophila]|uniref:Rod shape-determining protein MreB n=1 Tax=Thalassotalea psychrophila TaxID=3065647 RepID=A0ABY9TVD5_9GAMM|nr:rod shape-determining protein MreB [Colwelliaceae bacterium SQ149]
MLRSLLNKFSHTIYVQVWENRIRVVDTKTKITFDEKPFVLLKKTEKGEKIIEEFGSKAEYPTSFNEESINPFSHPRFLLSNFFVAEKLLQHAVYKILGKHFLTASPLIIMHPMEKLDGGLSQIEIRAFKELALGAGARDVVIFTGDKLDIENVNFQELVRLEEGDESPQETNNVHYSILIFPLLMFAYFFYIS